MGKIIVSIGTTPDGFVDAQNLIIDPEFFEFTQVLMKTAVLGVFGRHTFELFQDRWPPRLYDDKTPEWMRSMAQALHDIPKVVFSSTLTKTTWHNSTIIKKLEVDYIKDFKQNRTGALMTFGSISLIEELTAMNMVDDYYFNVQPVIAGKGETRFFSKMKLNTSRPLKYVDSTAMASGAHVIHYRNVGQESII